MKQLRHSCSATWFALLFAFALVVATCGDDGADFKEGDAAATTTTAALTAKATPATIAAPGATAAPATTAALPTTEVAPPLKPYGGEVIYGQDREPPTLNSFAPGGDNTVTAILGQAYWVGVQDIDGYTLEFIPDLVTELPTVANGGILINSDGTETVRYTIRDEAVWADGTPISGDDFKFTYDMIMDPDLPIVRAVYEDIIPETISFGPKTFEYTLAAPTVQAELLFGVLIPKHDVEGSDFMNDYNDTMWVSGGPFIFEQWQEGESISLIRNPNYWKTDPVTGQQLPYLDRVIMRFIPETASLIDAFRVREIDMMIPPPTIDAIQDLQTLEAEGARVEVLSGSVWEHLNFQFGENRFNKNPNSYNEFVEYRRAVAYAIDKNRIVDGILGGQVEPIDSYVEVFAPTLSQGSWAQYDYNPDAAIALLTDLCARVDTDCDTNPVSAIFSTTSNNDARVVLSQLLIEMFADVGIIYENQLEESSVFFGETLDFGNWDLAEWAWIGSPGLAGLVSIHDLFDPEGAPPDGQNFYRWGTPEVTGVYPAGYNQGPSSLIDESTARFGVVRDAMNATGDRVELAALIAEAEDILADNVVFIPLYARLDAGAVWADEVGGYKHNPTFANDTWNMEHWYRADL